MQIYGPTQIHGPQAINAPHRSYAAAPRNTASSVSTVDQLDISPQADMMSRLRDVPGIRAERVAQLRSAIEAGEYETDAKLNVALDRLLDEIGG